MIPHRLPRAFVRAFAAGLLIATPLVAGPAVADTPAAWATAPHVSGLDFLLVLLIIPAGIAVVISVLVALPSMIGGESGGATPAVWRGDGEWFGGPAKGVDTPATQKATGTGGGSATW